MGIEMGDPLSVTGSILALLEGGGAIGKVLKKVITLKRAPDIFLALNNEIAELHNIIHTFDELLQEQSDVCSGIASGRICESLEKVKRTLLEFERLVSYELTVVEGHDARLRLDKSIWLRVEPRVGALKDRVRADKADLNLELSLLTQLTS
ncbi:hypothetical protein OEA41_010885 [Lepraria neglecta]|uniref:Uncharacterized protein n=1 Tax=Lepraria neglecta TaxID=209136 RepID=A0AAE0DFJ3_9LECA|nr:hypothetical protein OEA41_010885 [Lepraria neglecta]